MPVSKRAELLSDLSRLSDEFDQLPSGQLVTDHGEHDLHEYREEFGSLPAALDAAGFDLPQFDGTRVSDADALHDLHRLLAELNRRPTSRDVIEHGRYSDKLYQDRWGSFNDALEAAGFRTDGPPVPTSLLLADLEQLADELGRPPTREEFSECSDLTRDTLEKRIGWENALRRVGASPSTTN
jgi:hypothetical protein